MWGGVVVGWDVKGGGGGYFEDYGDYAYGVWCGVLVGWRWGDGWG